MEDRPLGNATTLKQCIDGMIFFIHYQKDDHYITKIIISHGLIHTIDDHELYHNIDGGLKTLMYIQPMSHHNSAKHWVDEVNSHCCDPIDLGNVWATKWWPKWQFRILLSVVEVNTVKLQAHARKVTAKPQLTLQLKLTTQMMKLSWNC